MPPLGECLSRKELAGRTVNSKGGENPMKKFLSLVLALAMTMSLVTVSAGAKDFTDNSKIEYKEAVDVVSALGIVEGYEDGAFNPQNTLTRGAAAKIICNLILGTTTASALRADTAPYSDVPTTNTFAGYIAYCQKEGIISGYADGTFKPAATLTGYAFMKMLLGALGYDSDIEGYTGANWSIAVGKRALGIGLEDGNDEFVGVNAVTREEACLYAFNTLKATMVEYDAKTTVSVEGAQVTVGGSEAKNVKQDGYKSYTCLLYTSILGSLALVILCAYIGYVVHAVVVYSSAVRIFAGISPLRFFKGASAAMMFAFSTTSSAATIPVSKECADEMGADQDVAAFVLPLGATINMDGTAIYQCVATIFLATCAGMHLGLGQMVTIVITATLALSLIHI